ncbi:MAG: hypothetical protein V4506_02995 [Bacteroidota bacterium]
MGLFDIFKKKDNSTEAAPIANSSNTNELFPLIDKYKEYVVNFVSMQAQGNYSPISAYEKSNGELTGFLFINSDDSYTLSVEEVLSRMETGFEKKLAEGNIRSYAIFYHSQFTQNIPDHSIAYNDDQLKAISIIYNTKNGLKRKTALPYTFANDELSYSGFAELSPAQNNALFAVKLIEGKDYFQDREMVKSEVIENSIGLKISKSNNSNLSNTWGGIFGFTNFRSEQGSNTLKEYFALTLLNTAAYDNNPVRVSKLDFEDVTFKAVSYRKDPVSLIPVIKTDYTIEVENKEINEWENVYNLEAIVKGSGRSTFMVNYFATDYAENREVYLASKKLNIKLSAIAYVLDIHKDDENSELKYSEDFTAYMPNKDHVVFGCFDFIGQLESFRETSLLNDNSLKGYIMKVRLITNEEIKDFFTIDMFVSLENMRFAELQQGMKLTGMFQLQGQIA